MKSGKITERNEQISWHAGQVSFDAGQKDNFQILVKIQDISCKCMKFASLVKDTSYACACCIKIGTAEAENLYAALAIKKRSACYSFCYQ